VPPADHVADSTSIGGLTSQRPFGSLLLWIELLHTSLEHACDSDRKGQHGRGSSSRVLAFGIMSEKRLAIFAVSALGIVAVVLVGFWLVLGLPN
jgi:hypothetical protein